MYAARRVSLPTFLLARCVAVSEDGYLVAPVARSQLVAVLMAVLMAVLVVVLVVPVVLVLVVTREKGK